MSWLSGLSDALQSIPLNAVLRERVSLAEQKFKDLEAENKKLNEQIANLKAENESLKEQIEQAPIATAQQKEKPEIVRGLYFFGGDRNVAYCPRCYEKEGKKHAMAGRPHLGLKCTVCGNHVMR